MAFRQRVHRAGVTTAPSNYPGIITVTKRGTAGPTITFALTAGSLPPGLALSVQAGSSGAGAITGNLTNTRTFKVTGVKRDFA